MRDKQIQRVTRRSLVSLAYGVVVAGALSWGLLVSPAIHAIVFTAIATATGIAFTVFGTQTLNRLKEIDSDLFKYPSKRSQRAFEYVHRIRTRLTAWSRGSLVALPTLLVVAGICAKGSISDPRLLYVLGYSAALTVVLTSARLTSGFLAVNSLAPQLRRALDAEEERARMLAASKKSFSGLTETSGAFTMVPPQ
jgi:hypothetical protein